MKCLRKIALLAIVALQPSSGVGSVHNRYYSAIDADTPCELHQQLHHLIREQRYVPYKQVWRYLEDAYEVSSNSILLYYTRRLASKASKASGSNQAKSNYWNREHIWPQSKGLKKGTARRDLHNIVPADRSVNTSRGNKYFDIGGRVHKECTCCRVDEDSWEPTEQVKGDIARILFYMDIRYDGEDASRAPDLALVNGVSSDERHFRELSTLQLWHCTDSVDETERRRNDVVYRYQGNRNPFVDSPHWAEQVFRFSCL